MSTQKQEVKDFKFKAYRILTESDEKFQNWRAASTVELQLVVEIDGVEIMVARDALPYSTWETHLKKPVTAS